MKLYNELVVVVISSVWPHPTQSQKPEPWNSHHHHPIVCWYNVILTVWAQSKCMCCWLCILIYRVKQKHYAICQVLRKINAITWSKKALKFALQGKHHNVLFSTQTSNPQTSPFRRYTAPFQGLAIIAPRSTTPWEAGMNVSWWFILKSTRWLYINWFLAVFAPTDYPEEPPDLVVNSKKRVARWEESDATLSEASVMNISV